MKNYTNEEIRFFFKREEEDWQLVKEASIGGDEHAALAMAMVRLINIEIDNLWRNHDQTLKDFANHPLCEQQCRMITNRVGDLMKQRREVLYNDYKIQDKRLRIYRDSLKRQMKGQSLKNVIIN